MTEGDKVRKDGFTPRELAHSAAIAGIENEYHLLLQKSRISGITGFDKECAEQMARLREALLSRAKLDALPLRPLVEGQ